MFANLTANDTDPEGHYPLTLTNIVKNQGGASATIMTGSLVEVIFAFSAGDFSLFTYTVQDSQGASATGQLSVSTTSCGGGGLPF